MFEIIISIIVIIYIIYSMQIFVPASMLNKLAQILGLQDKPNNEEIFEFGVDSLINKTATVLIMFSKASEGMPLEGRVSARGTEWKAEQITGDTPLSIGNLVVIRRVKGTKLYVEAMEYSDV